jgi:hypothetical protein
MALWQQAANRLVALDRRWNFALRRVLGVVLIACFLVLLGLTLYAWFKLMQPYPE